jgi:hypothetical protein
MVTGNGHAKVMQAKDAGTLEDPLSTGLCK